MKKVTLFLMCLIMISCSSKRKFNQLEKNKLSNEENFYSEDILKSLPYPVKKYFKYALTDGQKYVKELEIKHSGTFKISKDKESVEITGEQKFVANPPSFVWVGKTKQFKAIDSYVDGQGSLKVYLLGLVRIQNFKGEYADQGELLRYFGEGILFPTNLLPNEFLKWSPIDSNSARLDISYNGIEIFFDMYFNQKGQIVKMETERYIDKENKEKWIGEAFDYQEVDGMMIPHEFHASWVLDGKKFTYAKFIIDKFYHKY